MPPLPLDRNISLLHPPARAVTPNDGADLPDGIARGLLVKTAGDHSLVLADDASGSPVTLNLAAGIVHALLVARVRATGAASLTGIIAFY